MVLDFEFDLFSIKVMAGFAASRSHTYLHNSSLKGISSTLFLELHS